MARNGTRTKWTRRITVGTGTARRSERNSAPLRCTISAFSFNTSTTARRDDTTQSGSKLALSKSARATRYPPPVGVSLPAPSVRRLGRSRTTPGTRRGRPIRARPPRRTRSRAGTAGSRRSGSGGTARGATNFGRAMRSVCRTATHQSRGRKATAKNARIQPVDSRRALYAGTCRTVAWTFVGPSQGSLGSESSVSDHSFRGSAESGLDGSFKEVFDALSRQIETVIRGKRRAIHLALVCLFAEGHLLVEDVPGVGKTSLAKAIARSVGGSWRRIQFTPDLLPSDVTGVSVWNRTQGDFEFRPGGVFANVVLADEINRASPKTQSALLEAMEEQQVTIDVDDVSAAVTVSRHRDAEPGGARGHLSPARSAARPLLAAAPDRLSRPRRRARDPRRAGFERSRARRPRTGDRRARGCQWSKALGQVHVAPELHGLHHRHRGSDAGTTAISCSV